MRRREKAHSTPPKAFRRRPSPPLVAVEDWGSGIAAEKQNFGAEQERQSREEEVYCTFSCWTLVREAFHASDVSISVTTWCYSNHLLIYSTISFIIRLYLILLINIKHPF